MKIKKSGEKNSKINCADFIKTIPVCLQCGFYIICICYIAVSTLPGVVGTRYDQGGFLKKCNYFKTRKASFRKTTSLIAFSSHAGLAFSLEDLTPRFVQMKHQERRETQ